MSDSTSAATGGCHCGDVKFTASAQAVLVELCHCRSCRHCAGAPLMAWVAFPRDAFAITAGAAAVYESSPGLQRSFCGRCGTSLTLTDTRFPEEIYVSVASLKDAEAMAPEFHIWRSHRLSWLETADSLPRYQQFRADGLREEAPLGA